MESKWYESFFEGVSLELWQKAIAEQRILDECAMIERVLQPTPRGRLLDVPCGPGRHLTKLAAKGYQMTGVDISEEALGKVRESLDKEGLLASLYCADMIELPQSEPMDAAYCLGNSFGYFDREQTLLFLSSLSRNLKRKAGFLLNTSIAAESILTAIDEKNWLEIDNILFLVENEYDAAQSRLDSHFIFVKAGKTERKSASHYIFTTSQIHKMLRDAGFHVKAMFSSTGLEPYEVGSDELYIYSVKV
jgi:cyclopropane fatty-acyl-phospholipid synthase-like methyltransferase